MPADCTLITAENNESLAAKKLAMAKELGAAYTVNAREDDPAAAIKALGGADAAISLAVSPRRSSRRIARCARAARW
jgi:propanol-preferring alcohol dehydrogenase